MQIVDLPPSNDSNVSGNVVVPEDEGEGRKIVAAHPTIGKNGEAANEVK